MKSVFRVAVFLALSFLPASLRAETLQEETQKPSDEVVAEARRMAELVFANLKEGKTEEIAKWVLTQVGAGKDAATKLRETSHMKSLLDILLLGPPEGAFGKLDGYDLIDESYLPGSNRYFRHSYISYHEGGPLVWEFRFYVGPKEKVALNFIVWDDINPFSYLSTSDMLLRFTRQGSSSVHSP
jgi:hypothetical protein